MPAFPKEGAAPLPLLGLSAHVLDQLDVGSLAVALAAGNLLVEPVVAAEVELGHRVVHRSAIETKALFILSFEGGLLEESAGILG